MEDVDKEYLASVIQQEIKEKLGKKIDLELEKVGRIGPQTWKIIAHNISKSIRDSAEFDTLVKGISSIVPSNLSNIGSNLVDNMSPAEFSVSKERVSDTNEEITDSNEIVSEKDDIFENVALQADHSEALVREISKDNSVHARRRALSTLNKAFLSETVITEWWPQLKDNLQQSLDEEDGDIFNLSLKVHSKLVQSTSPACIKEGLTNLISGIHLYYNKMCINYLPSKDAGLNLNYPSHQHLLKIIDLILQTAKELPKNWLRYGERRTEEIIELFITLLTLHICDDRFKLSDMLCYPFHIVAVLDPQAAWCKQWLYGAYGQNLVFNILSKKQEFLKIIIERVYLYLEAKQSNESGITFEDSLPGYAIEYATYIHSVSILTHMLSYKRGQGLFPVEIQGREQAVTLECLLIEALAYLNKNKKTFPNVLNSFLETALKNGSDDIKYNEKIIKKLLEPVREVRGKIKCKVIPSHIIALLLNISYTEDGAAFLLGYKPKQRQPAVKQIKTTYSAFGSRRNRTLERQCESANALRIPNAKHVNVDVAAKVIDEITASAIRNKDTSNMDILLSLMVICGRLYSLHEGLCVADVNNSTLLSAVLNIYKQVSSQTETSVYPSVFFQSLRRRNSVFQSQTLYGALVHFMSSLSNTPRGAFAVSQGGVLQDLVLSCCQSLDVPWENPVFRILMSNLTAAPEGASALKSEYRSLFCSSLNTLQTAFEDPVALMTGSDRRQLRAIQQFIDIIFTFAVNLLGITALLSEHEGSSEGTLVADNMIPNSLSDMLMFDHTGDEMWHFVSLLTLRALSSNMDVCLYLNATLNFQEKLLQLQSQNITNFGEEGDGEAKSLRGNIIVDECSLLRNQILISTYLVGGSGERCIPSINPDSIQGKIELFSVYPPPALRDLRSSRKCRSTRPKMQSELQKFLQDTRHGLHDINWLSHARRAYRISRQEDIKNAVLLDIVEQVSKVCGNTDPHLSTDWQEVVMAKNQELYYEEILGIELTIRYGVNCQLIQQLPQMQESLAHLLHISHSLVRHRVYKSFQGFDWFLATVFLLCGGSIDKCRSFIANFSVLPSAPFIWPAFAAAVDHSVSDFSPRWTSFGHLVESLVKIELPLTFSAFKLSGIALWLIFKQWLSQCFWNVLDWTQICQWLAVCVLNQPDFTLYFCISILRHMQPCILKAASEGRLWEQIMLNPVDGFKVGEQLPFMERLAKRYRSSLLPLLLSAVTGK